MENTESQKRDRCECNGNVSPHEILKTKKRGCSRLTREARAHNTDHSWPTCLGRPALFLRFPHRRRSILTQHRRDPVSYTTFCMSCTMYKGKEFHGGRWWYIHTPAGMMSKKKKGGGGVDHNLVSSSLCFSPRRCIKPGINGTTAMHAQSRDK